MDSLHARIRQEVGQARADRVESCRAIPFGAKPCGGPWSYLVFSVEASDSASLGALVEEYNAAEARLNREEDRVSDCALVIQPELALDRNECVAVDG